MKFSGAMKFFYNPSSRFHILFLITSGIVIFSPAVTFSFLIGWDDQTFVLNHYTEGGLDLKNICAIFTEFYRGQYAPLNQLYYSAIFEIFGYKPAWFHVFSICIHLGNALLVYFFIHRLSQKILPSNLLDKSNIIAFVTSLLFLLAPVNIEPVAWISASKVLLYAFFYLCSLIWYIKYVETGTAKNYYLTILSFLLSFAAKEQALTFPLAMLLIDILFRRNFRSVTLWLEKMPAIILSVLFVLASFQSQGRYVFISSESYSLIDRVLLSFYTLSEYFTKTLFPVSLSYVYPFPFFPGDNPPLWLWGYPAIAILIVLCLWRYLKNRVVFFGLLFFLCHIVMVCNLISLYRYSITADRYAYISSIGLLFIIATIVVKALNTPGKFAKVITISGFILYLSYFTIYTNSHIGVWKDAVVLKQKMREVIRSRDDYEK